MNYFPSRELVNRIKEMYPPGTRVSVSHMYDPYVQLPPNIEGTVNAVDDIGTLHCTFDNGTSLGLICGEDSFHIVQNAEKAASRPPRKKSHSHGR